MNIYVGNLVYAVTDEELKSVFSQFGEVDSSQVITFRSGKSKGFGFVTMPNNEQAQSAIDALNGQDYQGRALIVNEARPKEDRPHDHERRGGFRGGNRNHNRRFPRNDER